MPSAIFFRTTDGPIVASKFIDDQPENYQGELQAAARELEATGRITQGRCGLTAEGEWSLWLEDETGKRVNFILYISELATQHRSKEPSRYNSLGLLEELPGRPDDNYKWVEGSDVITSRFRGKIRDVLLEKLARAQTGFADPDGTIEFIEGGVILRAADTTKQVRHFAAEIKLRWKYPI